MKHLYRIYEHDSVGTSTFREYFSTKKTDAKDIILAYIKKNKLSKSEVTWLHPKYATLPEVVSDIADYKAKIKQLEKLL